MLQFPVKFFRTRSVLLFLRVDRGWSDHASSQDDDQKKHRAAVDKAVTQNDAMSAVDKDPFGMFHPEAASSLHRLCEMVALHLAGCRSTAAATPTS